MIKYNFNEIKRRQPAGNEWKTACSKSHNYDKINIQPQCDEQTVCAKLHYPDLEKKLSKLFFKNVSRHLKEYKLYQQYHCSITQILQSIVSWALTILLKFTFLRSIMYIYMFISLASTAHMTCPSVLMKGVYWSHLLLVITVMTHTHTIYSQYILHCCGCPWLLKAVDKWMQIESPDMQVSPMTMLIQ